jgi:hypothetical protein
MSKPKRLNKKILQEDREAYAALKALTDYKPANPAFSLANVDASFAAMDAKQTNEVQKKAEAAASSDDAADGEHDAHRIMLGVKAQVKAQYGEDSNEYQSLGMKKKSEYKRGRRTLAGNKGGTT